MKVRATALAALRNVLRDSSTGGSIDLALPIIACSFRIVAGELLQRPEDPGSRFGELPPSLGHPVNSLNDQAAQIWLLQWIFLVWAEVTVAQHSMKYSSFAESSSPGYRPGGSLKFDGRQRPNVGHHLHLII